MRTVFDRCSEPRGFHSPLRFRVDLTEAVEALRLMQVVIVPDSYSRRGRTFEVLRMSLDEYLAGGPLAIGGLRYLCPEMLLDERSARAVQFACDSNAVNAARALAHAGHEGDVSALHFDWDFAHVLQMCLSGQKRFLFAPPDAGWLLRPIVNESSISLRELSACDRKELLSMSGGCEVVLHAGDAILFPALWWHGVIYEDTTLAISVRFGEPEWAQQWTDLPPSWLLQRLVWRLAEQPDELAPCRAALQEQWIAPGSWRERRCRLLTQVRTQLCRRGSRHGLELASDAFDAELAIASEMLERLYTPRANAAPMPSMRGCIAIRSY